MADNSFKYYSNYVKESNFTQVTFGHNKGILETELNEMQQLQENARVSINRKLIQSGFIELVQKEFTGDSIIYNPIENGINQKNCIAIAPSRAFINGFELNLSGNFTYNDFDNYILVDLGDAPKSGESNSLVYLEAWFLTNDGDDNIKKWGYQNGDDLGTVAKDKRINVETSKRITLQWTIRVAKDINFDKFNEGFFYNNISNYSSIQAKANGQLGNALNPNLIFANAGHEMFKNCEFYKDYNLWVGGRPNYDLNVSTIKGNYIFALPMFKIRRRNSKEYSIENFNGATAYTATAMGDDSSIDGDLNRNIRPDKLFYDFLVNDDIIDLRKSVNLKEYNSNYYLDKTLNDVFLGKLKTKDSVKMRRLHFGNDTIDYDKNDNLIFAVKFDKSLIPSKPIQNASTPQPIDTFKYYDSINSYGVYIDGQNTISYDVSGSASDIPKIKVNDGTIDFYLKPFWHGSDSEISQTILSVVNESDKPILCLEKSGSNLVFSQYDSEVATNKNAIVNKATVDMNKTLLIANNIYHIRLAWTDRNMPLLGAIYLYINGKLCAQSAYTTCNLNPMRLKIGEVEDTSYTGFVIEELLLYNVSFEILINNNGGYGYAKNYFWPNMPQDIINSDSLFMQSFNSITNNFGDNPCIQQNTVIQLYPEQVSGYKKFILSLSDDKYVSKVTNVYDIDGNIISGTWSGIGSSIASFQTTLSVLDSIIVQFDVGLLGGNGCEDMPSEILSAGLITGTTSDDGGSTTFDILQEISFADYSSTSPREVKIIKPRRVSGTIDSMYDFKVNNRTEDQCYARLLYYNISGNGTNTYNIPTSLYGYDVIGILSAENRKINKITKKPSEILGDKDLYFTVYFDKTILLGEVITLEIALGGYCFDYDIQTKTIMSNMHKTELLSFTADGSRNEYIIPCFDKSLGSAHSGILKAVYTFTDNVYDSDGNISDNHPQYVYCYHDGELIVDIYGKPTGEKIYNTLQCSIDPSYFGTPFIKIKFSTQDKPKAGVTVQIPVLVSYQLKETDRLSIWYNYIPYQGLLNSDIQNMKRITDWKYFLTTLSSGKKSLNSGLNINSINNVVNHLPGGLSYAYKIDSKDIIFENSQKTQSKSDINSKLIFVNDLFLADKNNDLDDYFFNLNTDFTISKGGTFFQDGKINIKDNDFIMYSLDCNDMINKYFGMACLVVNDKNEIMLLVIGNLDYSSSCSTKLIPKYGDVFRIKGRPTTIMR